MEMIKQSNKRNFYKRVLFQTIFVWVICIFLFFLFFIANKESGWELSLIIIFLFIMSYLIVIKNNLYNITKIQYDKGVLFIEYYFVNNFKELSGNISGFSIDIKQTLVSRTKNYKLMIKYKNTNTLIEQYPNSALDENYWTSELIEEIHDKLNELKDEAIKQNKLNNKQ